MAQAGSDEHLLPADVPLTVGASVGGWQVTAVERHPEFLRISLAGPKGDAAQAEVVPGTAGEPFATAHYRVQPGPGAALPPELRDALLQQLETYEKSPGHLPLVAPLPRGVPAAEGSPPGLQTAIPPAPSVLPPVLALLAVMGLFIGMYQGLRGMKGMGAALVLALGISLAALVVRWWLSPFVPASTQGTAYARALFAPHGFLLRHMVQAIEYIGFTVDIPRVQQVNLILGSLGAGAVGLAAFTAGRRLVPALLAGVAAAVWPWHIIYATSLRLMPVQCLWFMACVALLLRYRREPSRPLAVCAGLAGLGLVMARPEGFVLWCGVALLAWLGTETCNRRDLLVFIMIVLAGIVHTGLTLGASLYALLATSGAVFACGLALSWCMARRAKLYGVTAKIAWLRRRVSSGRGLTAGMTIFSALVMLSHDRDNLALGFARYLLPVLWVATVFLVLDLPRPDMHMFKEFRAVSLFTKGLFLAVILYGLAGFDALPMAFADQEEFRYVRHQILPLLPPHGSLVLVREKDFAQSLDTPPPPPLPGWRGLVETLVVDPDNRTDFRQLDAKLTALFTPLNGQPALRLLSLGDLARDSFALAHTPADLYLYAGLDAMNQYDGAALPALAAVMRHCRTQAVDLHDLHAPPFDLGILDRLGLEAHRRQCLRNMPGPLSLSGILCLRTRTFMPPFPPRRTLGLFRIISCDMDR